MNKLDKGISGLSFGSIGNNVGRCNNVMAEKEINKSQRRRASLQKMRLGFWTSRDVELLNADPFHFGHRKKRRTTSDETHFLRIYVTGIMSKGFRVLMW
jgi:hypothetical protein